MVRNFISTGFAVLMAASALGHEGHGIPSDGNTVKHYVLDPLHLPLLMVLSVAVLAATVVIRKLVNGRYGM